MQLDGGPVIECYQQDKVAGAWLALVPGKTDPSLSLISENYRNGQESHYVGYRDGHGDDQGDKMAISVDKEGAVTVQLCIDGFPHQISLAELEQIVTAHYTKHPKYA